MPKISTHAGPTNAKAEDEDMVGVPVVGAPRIGESAQEPVAAPSVPADVDAKPKPPVVAPKPAAAK